VTRHCACRVDSRKLETVIASAAKQSMAKENRLLDCFVDSLLAMTANQT
jgi:hypothetical protein